MHRVTIAVLNAEIRLIDQRMADAVNDNNILEKLRKQRSDVTHEISKVKSNFHISSKVSA